MGDKLIFGILADLTVLIHFLWILFLIFGSIFGVRHKKVKYIHILGLVFSVFLQVFNLTCPLTYLENFFRKLAKENHYEQSFISYYLEKLVYIEINPTLIFIATLIMVGVHFIIYKKFSKQGI
ncbi:DUF2784 domain-containing protein [Sulfurihydrogenibium subterraneum]|uniref:DUF2784 domain-containing protein n=1 Tax=Sulfurihydrogenibium subterraneum TaxID=171121 RepID=UPI00048CAA86|nr:DUF2784 domain-containing protein [Sulfurihydrogenibium subterraneum]